MPTDRPVSSEAFGAPPIPWSPGEIVGVYVVGVLVGANAHEYLLPCLLPHGVPLDKCRKFREFHLLAMFNTADC